jgi:hypothetical protein
MIDAAMKDPLLREVERLSPPLQRQVVDYAHGLAHTLPWRVSMI